MAPSTDDDGSPPFAEASPDDGGDAREDVLADGAAQPELGLSSVEQTEDTHAEPEDAIDAMHGAEAQSDDAADAESDHDSLIVDLDAVEGDDLDGRPSRVSVVRSSVQPDGTEVVEQPTSTSDSFLDELRRAVEAPTDVVESDEDRALSAFFEHEDEEPKRRFGRRR